VIPAGLALIAFGAVFRFAVTADVAGVRIPTIGLILLIVGAGTLIIGLALRLAGDRAESSG
jgi:hypothetical protein